MRTVDVLLRFDDDWTLVPQKGSSETSKICWSITGVSIPLIAHWCSVMSSGVTGVNTHDEVKEFLEGLERQSLASPTKGVHTHAVRVARFPTRDEPLAEGTKDRELVGFLKIPLP